MPQDREQAIEKIRRDHEHMTELVRRITAMCSERGRLDNCNQCHSAHRDVCHGNIEALIRAFVETTLRHNLMESMFMEAGVPHAHRIAHNRAHVDIAEQLKAIRVVFAKDGNAVLAIEGIDRVLATLRNHLQEFDEQLEHYLLAEA